MSGLKPITVNTAPEADPHIYAEDDAAIYQSIFGSDGVMTIGQQCASQVISNNKVRVKDGVIVAGGHVARIPYGEYIDCEIANGQSGVNRNDIIIAKFVTTGSGGIDTYTCEVKQGVAGSSASDPALTQNDLYAGGKIRETPLYRVKIEGLSIVAVEQLFELVPTIPELEEQLAELNSNLVHSVSEQNGMIFERNGKLVTVSFNKILGGVQAGVVYTNQGSIPEGYRPSATYKNGVFETGTRISGSSITGHFYAHLLSSGVIEIVSQDSHSGNNSYVFTKSYFTDD